MDMTNYICDWVEDKNLVVEQKRILDDLLILQDTPENFTFTFEHALNIAAKRLGTTSRTLEKSLDIIRTLKGE